MGESVFDSRYLNSLTKKIKINKRNIKKFSLYYEQGE